MHKSKYETIRRNQLELETDFIFAGDDCIDE